MTVSLTCACFWAVIATAIALGPRRWHWTGAWVLIGTGVPLTGWITLQNGPVIGMIALAAGVSVLRWPVHYLLQTLAAATQKPAE